MLAAEKWYEYQTDYHKYGLEMKPKKLTKKKIKGAASKPVSFSAKDKLFMIFLTIFLGGLCISLIIGSAYAAKIKYHTNEVIRQTSVLQGEIENLNVEIKSQNSIEAIESKAINDYGMVYPDASEYIKLTDSDAPKDFALALKQQAFGPGAQ